jgi:nucleoside-diphosphate-sugar epimerase
MILVTGGAGYIGCVVVKKLLQKNKKVRVFDKLYFGKNGLKEFENKIEIIQGDVRKFDDKVLDGIEGVIHFGSLSNDPTADFNPKANYEINYKGTLNIAKACKKKKIKKFTFASTAAVYGFQIEEVVKEDFPVNPQSEYAKSKLYAENELINLASDEFCPVIFRQGTGYGFSPRMRYDLVVNTFVRDAYINKKLIVYSKGEIWRPLIDIDDVADAHILVLESDEDRVRGQIFNLVYKNYKILELANLIKNILKDKISVEIDVEDKISDKRSYKISGEKLQRVLGFKPKVSISSSVKKIWNILNKGLYTDFDNPIYYNIEWMKLLVDIEERLKQIGRVF